MDLENISIDFSGKINYFNGIKKDLETFPQDTFSPFGESYHLKVEVKNDKDSITIQPSKEGKTLSIKVPEEASNVIIDHTNRTTNFIYNQKKYYIFAEKR